jgi:hypothetical protein
MARSEDEFREFDGVAKRWLESVGVDSVYASIVNHDFTTAETASMEEAAFIGAGLAHRVYVRLAEPQQQQPAQQSAPVQLRRLEKLRKLGKRAHGVLQLTTVMWAAVARDARGLL